MSEASRRAAEEIDLECTGEDDHDSPVCRKCERIRSEIDTAIARAVEGERTRLADELDQMAEKHPLLARLYRSHAAAVRALEKEPHVCGPYKWNCDVCRAPGEKA